MQIIIVQTEIEEAIRNHILGQITVKEGQRIDIDLRATRGSDGFQAVIDIVADGSPQRTVDVAPALAADPEPPVVEAAPTKTKVKSVTKPTAAKPVEVEEVEVAEEIEIPESEIVPTGSTFDTEPTEAPIEDGADEPAPKKTSLFANMKKPVNS